MGWSAFLLGVIKAIPLLHSLFLKIVELYYIQQDIADENRVNAKATEREKILAELKQKDLTDERRNELRKALYNASRG